MPAIALIVCISLSLLSHGLAHYDPHHQQQPLHTQHRGGHRNGETPHQYLAGGDGGGGGDIEHANQLETLHQAPPHARHNHQTPPQQQHNHHLHHSHHHHHQQQHHHYHQQQQQLGARQRSNQVMLPVNKAQHEPHADHKHQHLHHHQQPESAHHQQRDIVHSPEWHNEAAPTEESAAAFSVSLNIDGHTMAPHLPPAATTTTEPALSLGLGLATASSVASPPMPTPAPGSAMVTHAHHQQAGEAHQHATHSDADNRHQYQRIALDYPDKDYYDDDGDEVDDVAVGEHDVDEDDNLVESRHDNLYGWAARPPQRFEGYSPQLTRDHHHQSEAVADEAEYKRHQRGAHHHQQHAQRNSPPMPLDDYADDEPYRDGDDNDDLHNYQRDAPATSTAASSAAAGLKPGVLTEQKFKELGNPEAVQRSLGVYVQQQERRSPSELARQHQLRMRLATCKYPQARVVNVSNDTSKSYMPRRTILHRCGDDTGCCDIQDICVAKTTELVELYFFVHPMHSHRVHIEVKRLPNDTECHCISLEQYENARRNKRHNPPESISRFFYNLPQTQPSAGGVAISNELHTEPGCKCPRHFERFISGDTDKGPVDVDFVGRSARHFQYRNKVARSPCRCDCSSSNDTCKRLQSGQEGFAMSDRKCIADGLCQPPKCLHGYYNILAGRCPTPRTDYAYG